nr:immunoglobulin heavy chain junction region [Macaca mulatta]
CARGPYGTRNYGSSYVFHWYFDIW